jgi:hypothetical protein
VCSVSSFFGEFGQIRLTPGSDGIAVSEPSWRKSLIDGPGLIIRPRRKREIGQV